MKTDSRIPDCVRDQLPLPLNGESFRSTHHHELRRDVSLDCSSPSLTDQSYAQACDINVIMAQYAKTGMLPVSTVSIPRFVDNTLVPSLERSFDIVHQAMDMFYDLPAPVRRLMDNDPSKLETFLADPSNRQFLIDQGVLVIDPDTIPQPLAEEAKTPQPPPVG